MSKKPREIFEVESALYKAIVTETEGQIDEIIDDKICYLMMRFGPDGHIDGHEEITEFVLQSINESISQHNELLIKKIQEMLVPDEITASSNPRWVYNKSKKDIITIIKNSK